jgi:hypothetical protein
MRALLLAALLALATVGTALADDDSGSGYRPPAPISIELGAPSGQ